MRFPRHRGRWLCDVMWGACLPDGSKLGGVGDEGVIMASTLVHNMDGAIRPRSARRIEGGYALKAVRSAFIHPDVDTHHV